MTSNIKGNVLQFKFEANELTSNNYTITLPDGYSFENIIVLTAVNITTVSSYLPSLTGITLRFPPVKSHSPNILNIYVSDLTKVAELRIIITKFGQIPDSNYFNRAFEPILVVGDDGKEYNVIPSDQFK